MADFSEITQEINEHINTNGQRAITGAKLNEVLRDMISTVNEKKQDTLTIDSTPTEGSTNPVQSGGVEEALGSLYQALSVAENCLFGGLVTRLESPSQGDDHRYYYITQQGGYFSHFDVTIPNDTHMATMIYWSDILSRWVTIGLWPTMTYVDAKANKVSDATQGNLAGLDSDGNLTDSGIASSEVATQSDISGFITNTVNNLTNYYLKSETYTQAEINALIGAIQQFHYEIYATLPQTGQSNVLYLIGPTGSGSDKYEEYVYSNSVFTKIGDTSIDLSGYVTTSALNTALADYTTTANLTTLLSDKADKCIPSTTGNIAKLTAQGNLADGGVLAADVATVMQLEYKADRVNNATNGNLAGLDSNGNLTDSGFSPSDFLETTVNTTYSELVALKNNGNLIPGAQYRITDYTCTTTQVNTQSAGNAFDIIVTADSETELNENARATHHNGDTYFANCNLDAWELKYCLENDTNRFAWADSTNGKGVIYYMKDEWNNECPYDFKNILTTYGGGANYYTFDALVNSVHYDLTVAQTSRNCYGNTIGVYHEYGGANRLGRNIFGNTSLSSSCHNNSLGENCYNNTFNNGCINNTFWNNCSNNSFGSNCTNNIFGNYCTNNIFGGEFTYNSFGSNCLGNSFGNGCTNNSFGNYCNNNSFGSNYRYNTLRNDCTNNSFGGYCQAITVFDGVQYCSIIGGSSNSFLVKNAQILNGTKGTSSSRLYIEFEKNKDYTQVAGLVNGTELRIWIAEDTVTGPTTATDSHIAVFDGTSGKAIKDSGLAISDLSPDLITPTTYSELVALKVGGTLVPGMKYRITDYNTTVSEDLTDVSVAEHQFDIIVTALSETELDHRASAIQHEGDTYFSDCDLSKWKLWYDIENDTEKYEWALGDGSSSNGGAKGGVSEFAPEYIFNEGIGSLLGKANLSMFLVFQGIESIEIDKESVDCYIYGTSVQAESLGYVKLFCKEYPSIKEYIHGIDNKGDIHEVGPIDVVSSSTQPTNGTKVIAKSVQSDKISETLNKVGLDKELEFNGRIVMYKGQNCYSYGSSAQYDALDYINISDIIVADGVSPVAPKKIEEQGTELALLYNGVTLDEDTITTVSQETVVVGGNSGGKGVIYRMIDEWDNDCPYDFKNIMFVHSGDSYYTFDAFVDAVHYDLSVFQTNRNCYGNTIGSYFGTLSSYKLFLPINFFKNVDFESECHSNKFGNDCTNNTFSGFCYDNSFGSNCNGNSFGNYCQDNSFGNYCQYNSFGDSCKGNSFGNYCVAISFGNNCSYNSFGNFCSSNSFGNYCQYDSFGNNFQGNTFGNYLQGVTVFDNVQYCNVTGGTSSSPVRNAHILNGTKGTNASNKLTITFTENQDYTQVAGLLNGTTLRIWIAENTVTGPQTSTNNHIAVFDGATGKIVKDGGYAPSDFATANQGALADTAYQKPLTGIPASDLASGVIPTIPVQDVTVGGTSVVTNGVAVVPAIPDISGKEDTSNKVSTISGNETNTTKYPNTKATYDAIHPAYGSSQPQDGMLPNVLYKLGTLSGSVTIAFATPTDNTIENEYKFTFTADSTAPTITWPQSVTSWIGNSLDNGAPKVEASNYYECSVIDGHGIFNKF